MSRSHVKKYRDNVRHILIGYHGWKYATATAYIKENRLTLATYFAHGVTTREAAQLLHNRDGNRV